MTPRFVFRLAVPVLLLFGLPAGELQASDSTAAGVIARLEPPDTGVAYIRGNGRDELAGFMAPVYPGDRVVVESLGTVVHVRLFGRGTAVATDQQPLDIGPLPPERGLTSNVYAAILDKLVRSGERPQRNLVTRADDETLVLELYGWRDPEQRQKLLAGHRELFVRWNHYLNQARYTVREAGRERVLAEGFVSGDFFIAGPFEFAVGQEYRVTVQSASGNAVQRYFVVAAELPELPRTDPALEEIGLALRLLALADVGDGEWTFEAIQGVLDLSADSLDRRALIDELALFGCCPQAADASPD